MDPKLKANIAASWKMYSVRFLAAFSTAATAAIGWFLTLPADCAPLLAKIPPVPCSTSQTSFLAQFGIGAAAVPAIGLAAAWWYRVKPQTNLTPAEAETKSAAAPNPPNPPDAST